MKLKPLTGIIFTGFLLLLLAGCDVTRKLGPKEYLLIKNKIRIADRSIPAEELEPYLQQVPNTKALGLFRSNIAIYNMGKKGKDNKFKKWLRTKVGSEPVILDTGMVSIGVKEMTIYAGNKGFFQSSVTDSIIYKKKKATVVYRVRPRQPYKVRNLTYAIPDTQVATYVYRDTAKCLIRKRENYDAYLLDNERARITTFLRNNGYFRFSTSYIKYHVDTNLRLHLCDVSLEIINQVVPSFDIFTTVRQVPHKRYFINKVYVYPQFDHVTNFTGAYDTLAKSFLSQDKGHPLNTYYFLHRTPMKVRPATIAQAIFIQPRSVYNLKDLDQSYAQLSSLQVFKYINIQFKEEKLHKKESPNDKDSLDCLVELSRAPDQSYSVTTDGTNSAGAFGVQASLGYQNRNIFRGAQLFRFNINGALQMQATDGTTAQTFFNTIELGATAGLTFPQFLIPIRQEKLPKNFKPKTTISIGYNYQHQQHYDRHISNITFGYSWMQNENIRHVLNPMELSLVKVFPDAYFTDTLNNTEDVRVKNQYTDHMVAGLKYTFNLSNQKINKVQDFIYMRANFETGGNLIYAIDEIFKVNKNPGSPYTLFGLPYAQYVRPDVDFRYYNVLGKKQTLVYRLYGGIGIPYGNSTLLPFEKAFFAGGANGMRGWKMYTLGPGTYKNTNPDFTYNQIGDIQMEGNVEFRFPVYQWIRASVFLDAGNIWLLQESKDLPGGKFTFNNFVSEFGLDGGFGIRFDFDFFIFRFDPAIRLRDPVYGKNDRWYFNKMQMGDIVWNFGIGYPF